MNVDQVTLSNKIPQEASSRLDPKGATDIKVLIMTVLKLLCSFSIPHGVLFKNDQ